MSQDYHARVVDVWQALSRGLAGQGAEAVVAFGSWVRGDAYRESDVDIHAIGRGPHYMLERYHDFLVSVSWATVKQHRQAFKDPSEVGGIMPAWRNVVILYDPKEIAKALKQEALRWQWDLLGKRPERWVAEQLTGYAEEVHRLIGDLQLQHETAASVQRSLLAIHLAPILAVHHRILYDSENRLWDLVSEKMGAKWAKVQKDALGTSGQSFEETCRAALQLFALAAREVANLLNKRQYQVVAHACKIADYPLPEKDSISPKKGT
jgi:predicted nucleotidyltransferase